MRLCERSRLKPQCDRMVRLLVQYSLTGGSISVHLAFSLEELDSIKQVNLLLFNFSKAAESKQVKQEVIHNVKLSL